MKKKQILSLLSRLASPVALMILGAVLLFSPDSASVFIAKLLGMCVFAAGIGFAVAAVFGSEGRIGKCIGAAVCIYLGGWLLRSPLLLAKGIGRIIGILLLFRGGRDFFQSSRRQGKILSAVVAVLGVVLIVLPMTTSRVVFSLCGLVVLTVGAVMLVERLRERRCLNESNDPNIIDAL